MLWRLPQPRRDWHWHCSVARLLPMAAVSMPRGAITIGRMVAITAIVVRHHARRLRRRSRQHRLPGTMLPTAAVRPLLIATAMPQGQREWRRSGEVIRDMDATSIGIMMELAASKPPELDSSSARVRIGR